MSPKSHKHDPATPRRPYRRGEAAPVSPADLDRSCRWPVLLLLAGALKWLFAGSALLALALFKLQTPALLAHCPWLTYGRIFPAATSILVYGFAIPALLGIGYWMLCRLGKVPFGNPFPVLLATQVWNFGLLAGVIGILAGESTGYEWLELPRYAGAAMLAAFLVMALWGGLLVSGRTVPGLYVSQWYLLALLFGFAWIFSAAQMLLIWFPVPGVVQVAAQSWFAGNLLNLVLPAAGLAVLFYFTPQLAGRPLHSDGLARLGFWTLVLFGTWCGISASLPLPRWMISVSTVAQTCLLVSVLAVAGNLHLTVRGAYALLMDSVALRFLGLGMAMYVVFVLLGMAASQVAVSEMTEFTVFNLGRHLLLLYGFLGLAIFSALYLILPRLLGQDWGCRKLSGIHFLTSAAGVLLVTVPLIWGGMVQGAEYNNHRVPFAAVEAALHPYLAAAAFGSLVVLASQLVFFLQLTLVLKSLCRGCCCGWKPVSQVGALVLAVLWGGQGI